MVNVIICGPAGAGKKKLIEDIRSKCTVRVKDHKDILHVASRVLSEHNIHSREDYKCDDRNYIDIQVHIIQRQCGEERKIEGQDFISDNCIINSLVQLRKCIGADITEHIIETSTEVVECVERYKRSLILFLSPIQYGHDDGTCLKLSQDQWAVVRETYLGYFRRFHIPFLEIKSAIPFERLTAVKEAFDGKLSLESSTLANYDQKKKDEDRIISTNFLFHLTRNNNENSIAIPTIEITEHFSRQLWTNYMDGETNRFIAKEGHANIICLKFDISVKSTIVQRMLLGGVYINGLHYSFLGCSANGLKTRLFYVEGTTSSGRRNTPTAW